MTIFKIFTDSRDFFAYFFSKKVSGVWGEASTLSLNSQQPAALAEKWIREFAVIRVIQAV